MFFKSSVRIGYKKKRKYHYFLCTAKKYKGSGGVQWFLDSKDCAGTSNLRTHAIKCFESDTNKAATLSTKSHPCDGSIFVALAHSGQQPNTTSHCALTVDKM